MSWLLVLIFECGVAVRLTPIAVVSWLLVLIFECVSKKSKLTVEGCVLATSADL